tara:strand:+ start:79590 stop:81122 length:1533 start_codon:yes stop_codon:yes gene_type:complete
MHKIALFITLIAITSLFAQPNTDVYLFDLKFTPNGVVISNMMNVSNDPGYDSQPSFRNDNELLFAGNNFGQTDIKLFNIDKNQITNFNASTPGGEYSPQAIPNSMNVAAVRLDTNGLQRLYRYQPDVKRSSALIPEIQVAYYAFYDENISIASVLSGNVLDLTWINLQKKTTDTIVRNVGRSIHRIPKKEAMSYTAVNEEGNHDVFQLDIKDGESYFVCQLPVGIQDHCWIDDTRLLLGSNDKLFMYDLFGKDKWEEVADLSEFNLKNISRITVSANGKKLALVAEPAVVAPGDVVQKHIAPFNARDLDAFVHCFSDNVVVKRFPNELMYTGRTAMKENYKNFYARNEYVDVSVKNRITIGNTVIDEEVVNIMGEIKNQATIYTVENEKIATMTFIANEKSHEDPEIIVDKQLDAYNLRDIEKFIATYQEDIKLYNFPGDLTSEGKEGMQIGYGSFFANTTDLHCEIKNRIVIGNKVIDEELVTINGGTISAVAIYEVENGLISKVTFIR